MDVNKNKLTACVYAIVACYIKSALVKSKINNLLIMLNVFIFVGQSMIVRISAGILRHTVKVIKPKENSNKTICAIITSMEITPMWIFDSFIT